MHKERLDQFAQDIEFLLISVVQGVALATLAASATGPIGNFEIEYWPYVASAFILILNFWAQAILHTFSFIDWPLDLPHNFLYFLVSLVEVMTFAHLNNPQKWFGFISLFFVIAAFLYFFDFLLIKNHEAKFQSPKHKRLLYQHIVSRQKREIFVFLPVGFIFNIVSFALIMLFPQIFLERHYHVVLVLVQVVVGALVMIDFMRSFHTRSLLLSAAGER